MKRQEFFGEVRYGTNLTCGYDGGYDDRGVCGSSAVWHAWPGTPPETRSDSIVYACDDHFAILTGELWDYHRTGGACGIPGATWYNGTEQGQGCCKHDLDFETLDVAMTEPLSVTDVLKPQNA